MVDADVASIESRKRKIRSGCSFRCGYSFACSFPKFLFYHLLFIDTRATYAILSYPCSCAKESLPDRKRLGDKMDVDLILSKLKKIVKKPKGTAFDLPALDLPTLGTATKAPPTAGMRSCVSAFSLSAVIGRTVVDLVFRRDLSQCVHMCLFVARLGTEAETPPAAKGMKLHWPCVRVKV